MISPLGRCFRDRLQIAEATSHLYDAVESSAAVDVQLHRRSALALATLQIRLSDGAAAVQTLNGLDPGGDPELAADLATTTAIGHWQNGDVSRALGVLDPLPRSPQGTAWEAESLAARGLVLLYSGDLLRAHEDLDASIGLSHLWRPSTNQARVYLLRSKCRFQLGDWDGASADAMAGLAIADGQAQPWSVSLAFAALVSVPAWRGHWRDRRVPPGSRAIRPHP